MAALQELSAWWNLLFLLPMAVSVVLLLISGLGGMGEADTDTDHDTDHSDADDSPLADALRHLGVGAVPLSLLAQAFLLFFGVAGLATNRLFMVSANPERNVWASVAVALFLGLVGAFVLGALGRRFLPTEGPALANRDLISRTGRVVFAVTENEGTVQVRDAGGTLHQIAARVPLGEEPIEAGQEVLVVSYDSEQGIFLVNESPFSAAS
jgi:membrane protein implicated in regulation of membrane protease activity